MAVGELEPAPIKGSDMHPGTLRNIAVAQADVDGLQEISNEADTTVTQGLLILRAFGKIEPPPPDETPAPDTTERRGRSPSMPMVTIVTDSVPFTDGKPQVLRFMHIRAVLPAGPDGEPVFQDPEKGTIEIFSHVQAANAPDHLPPHAKARTSKEVSLAGVEWSTQPREDGRGMQRIAKPYGASAKLNSRESMTGMQKTLHQINSWLLEKTTAAARKRA